MKIIDILKQPAAKRVKWAVHGNMEKVEQDTLLSVIVKNLHIDEKTTAVKKGGFD